MICYRIFCAGKNCEKRFWCDEYQHLNRLNKNELKRLDIPNSEVDHTCDKTELQSV